MKEKPTKKPSPSSKMLLRDFKSMKFLPSPRDAYTSFFDAY